VAKSSQQKMNPELELVLEHLRNIFDDKEMFDYFLSLSTKLIRDSENTPKQSLIVSGEKGCGKVLLSAESCQSD
jgi:hypothetical protein